MPNNQYLFVYGSLRSGFPSGAYEYIGNHFSLISNAKVKGILYDLGEYPAALPTLDENFITGELYKLKNENDFNWIITQIDEYEGLYVEQGEIPLYRREIVEVYLNNKIIEAWIYWYNHQINNEPVIESGDILDYIKSKMN